MHKHEMDQLKVEIEQMVNERAENKKKSEKGSKESRKSSVSHTVAKK